jgi:chaperonin GroES
MNIEIKPIGDRLLIERLEAEETTPGGILLPEKAQERPHLARVLAIGSEVKAGVRIGDVILFKKYAGQSVAECLIIEAEEALAVVEGWKSSEADDSGD